MPFTKLGLAPAVLDGVRAAGYVTPTPIQLRAIPLVLAGRDVIGSAQTGTGKTAAFALPILSKLGQHDTGSPRALVLEPTRELAAQVETAFRDYARFTKLKVAVVYGGVGYGRQNEGLRGGADVLVATCWTWAFCPTCGASWKNARDSATRHCFPRPFRRKSKRSSNGR